MLRCPRPPTFTTFMRFNSPYAFSYFGWDLNDRTTSLRLKGEESHCDPPVSSEAESWMSRKMRPQEIGQMLFNTTIYIHSHLFAPR